MAESLKAASKCFHGAAQNKTSFFFLEMWKHIFCTWAIAIYCITSRFHTFVSLKKKKAHSLNLLYALQEQGGEKKEKKKEGE